MWLRISSNGTEMFMKKEPQDPETQYPHGGQLSRDRSDWILKYLELADRIIQAHMPQAREQEEA